MPEPTSPNRQPWSAPVLRRIAAKLAESGTLSGEGQSGKGPTAS